MANRDQMMDDASARRAVRGSSATAEATSARSTAITTSPSGSATTAATCGSPARVRSRPTPATRASSPARWARARYIVRGQGQPGVATTRARTAPAAGMSRTQARKRQLTADSLTEAMARPDLERRPAPTRSSTRSRGLQGHRPGDGRPGRPRRGPAHAAPGPQLQGLILHLLSPVANHRRRGSAFANSSTDTRTRRAIAFRCD